MKTMDRTPQLRFGQALSVLSALLAFTGCSLSAPDASHLMISMPTGGLGNSTSSSGRSMNLAETLFSNRTTPTTSTGTTATGSSSGNGNSDFPVPTQLSDFACAAIMVTAPDISADPTFTQGCGPVDTNGNAINVGVFAGFVTTNGGVLDVQVQNGSARTFQLIGLQVSTSTCPAVADLLAQNNNINTGNPYLLASVTQDVAGDQSISLSPSFTAGTKPAFDCSANHGNGNGSNASLQFSLANNSPAILHNTCFMTGVSANNSNGASVPPVSVSVSNPADVTLYASQSDCSNNVNPNPASFLPSGQQYLTFYMKTGLAAGTSFSAQIQTTQTGWTTQAVTFNVVGEGITLESPMGLSAPGGCQPIPLTSINSGLLDGGPSVFEDQAGLANGGNSGKPSIIIYSDANCANPVPALAASSNNYNNIYDFSFSSASSTQTFSVRDPLPEKVLLQVSIKDNSLQPAGGMVSFGVPPLAASFAPSALSASNGNAFSASPLVTAGVISNCLIPADSPTQTLPNGLALSASCAISGTPTATSAQSTYILNASDAAGDVIAISFSLVVQ